MPPSKTNEIDRNARYFAGLVEISAKVRQSTFSTQERNSFATRHDIARNTAMNAQTPAIEFRNVTLSFDDDPVLNDVSFTLEHGEMILLTGFPGSGKSVLLLLAIGVLEPDSGEILIDGKQIQKMDASGLLAVRGGLMGI